MKGNMFLGYARGSVGDVVFSRVKGQQTGRARNRQPSNPKSEAQMQQRARFAYLSKFYARATKAFFKFSFESKKSTESDYNAFMSANMSITPWATRKMIESPYTPYVGAFRVCQGSLPSLDGLVLMNNYRLGMPFSWLKQVPTVGDLSSSLLDYAPQLSIGDYVTFVLISASEGAEPATTMEEAMKNEQLILNSSNAPGWKIIQIKINTQSTTPLATLGFEIKKNGDNYTAEIFDVKSDIQGGIIVASRKTADGIKVSDASIVLESGTQLSYEMGLESVWAEFATQTWNPGAGAILDGSVADAKLKNSDPFTYSFGPFPMSMDDTEKPLGTIQFKRTLAYDDIKFFVDGETCPFNRVQGNFAIYQSTGLSMTIQVPIANGHLADGTVLIDGAPGLTINSVYVLDYTI